MGEYIKITCRGNILQVKRDRERRVRNERRFVEDLLRDFADLLTHRGLDSGQK